MSERKIGSMADLGIYPDDIFRKSREESVMNKWIKELEKDIFEITNIKGNLVCKSSFPHVVYGVAESGKITLHGDFTIAQLEALTQHMKRYQK